MAAASPGDTAASNAGARGLDASRVHDVAWLVLRALRIRRRHPRTLDADRCVEAEWRYGSRLCRDDGTRAERRCGARVVQVARAEAEVHVFGEGSCDEARVRIAEGTGGC